MFAPAGRGAPKSGAAGPGTASCLARSVGDPEKTARVHRFELPPGTVSVVSVTAGCGPQPAVPAKSAALLPPKRRARRGTKPAPQAIAPPPRRGRAWALGTPLPAHRRRGVRDLEPNAGSPVGMSLPIYPSNDVPDAYRKQPTDCNAYCIRSFSHSPVSTG